MSKDKSKDKDKKKGKPNPKESAIVSCPPMSEKQLTACKDDPDLDGTPARKVCDAINQKSQSDEMKELATSLLKTFNPLSIFQAKAKSNQKIVNELSTKMSTKDYTNQYNECNQITTQTQSNVIIGPKPKCLDILSRTLSPDDYKKTIDKMGISHITQQNIARAATSCKADLLVKALTECTASIDNTALQKSLNQASGAFSDAESNQDICNNISINMSACKYLQQHQCCAQQTSQRQKNVLDAGCPVGPVTDILQTNTADSTNSCILSSQASVTTDMGATITNTVSQSAENKAEGLTMGPFILIIIVIIIILFVGPVFAIYKGGQAILKYLGPIVMLIGGGFVAAYFFTGTKEITKYNDPFILYSTSTKYLDQLQRSTFKDAKERVKQSDVLGYDFFIDIGDDGKGKSKAPPKPSEISDDQTGSVGYVTVMPDTSSSRTSFDSKQMATVSFGKEIKNIQFLIIGIILIIIGLIITIAGLMAPKPPIKDPKGEIDLLDPKTRTDKKDLAAEGIEMAKRNSKVL